MALGQISGNVQLAGLAMNLDVSRTQEGQISQDPILHKGFVGSLTTRTDDDTGVVTVASHDILDTDYVDIYWDGGVAYGGDVTAKTGTTIDVDLLSGDNLPDVSTAVIISKRTQIAIAFDGDDLAMIAAYSASRGHIVFETSVPADIHNVELLAGDAWYWVSGMGWTNDLAGDPVAFVQATTADTDDDTQLLIGVLYSSVA